MQSKKSSITKNIGKKDDKSATVMQDVLKEKLNLQMPARITIDILKEVNRGEY